MFFVLSKILVFLLMPVLWVLGLLIAALLTRVPRRRLWWLRGAFGLLLLLTNPWISNQLWQWWETPPVPVRSVGHYEAAILLTGITEPDRVPHDRVYMGRGADRLLHTVWLYRRGCFARIIVSGGSGSVIPQPGRLSEAAELRRVLLSCGVPDSAIVLEDKSRNTHENAVNTAALLGREPKAPGAEGRYLLITSAFHMRRAEGCFKRVGLAVDVFPADYTALPTHYTPDALLLPNEAALFNWNRLLHEVAGYLTYRLAGYC